MVFRRACSTIEVYRYTRSAFRPKIFSGLMVDFSAEESPNHRVVCFLQSFFVCRPRTWYGLLAHRKGQVKLCVFFSQSQFLGDGIRVRQVGRKEPSEKPRRCTPKPYRGMPLSNENSVVPQLQWLVEWSVQWLMQWLVRDG